jgi:hypothetical protein
MEGTDRPRGRRRLLVVGLLCTAALAAVAALYCVEPGWAGTGMPCIFHSLTGLHCPGCGATRAAHRLLHGDLAGALRMNALAVLALPLAAYWIVRNVVVPAGHAARRRPLRPWLVWGGIGLILLFGVLRNLPFEPFVRLAPLPEGLAKAEGR